MNEIFLKIGEKATELIEEMGRIITLLFKSIIWLLRPPFKLKNAFRQMEVIGVNSVSVVLLTGFFTGAVFAIQTYRGFHQFNAEHLVGYVVALSLTRELGHVLTALMVTGRAGSLIAAELASMRVSEQIDAMEVMAVNPIQYLIV